MKKIIPYILVLLFFNSCSEKLEISSELEMDAVSYWKTDDQAIAAGTAMYQQLQMEGCYQHWTPVLNDGKGDEIHSNSPWLDYGWVSNFTIGITGTGSIMQLFVWEDWYRLIWRTNQVLENIPGIDMVNQDEKERILGQAYFLRGLAYFNLNKMFDKVPIITSTPKGKEDYNTPTGTKEDLWARIIADFSSAIDMLPVNYNDVVGSDKGQIGRATKGAAIGFLGKTYLYQKEWQKAADEFAILVVGELKDVYDLTPNYRDNFTDVNENNIESVFEVQFASVDDVGGTDPNWHSDPTSNFKQISSIANNYSNKSWTDFLPNQWLYDQYKLEKTVNDSVDPRLIATLASYEPKSGDTLYYEKGWITSGYDTTVKFIRKYTNDGKTGITTELNGDDPISGINYRVMRYADILLMYAEALNELGSTADAYTHISRVRARVGLAALDIVKPGLNQAQMRDQIAHERLLELAVEGQRINDIIRWGWFYDPIMLTELKTRDSEFNTYTEGREFFPIPKGELDANPNAQRNSAN